jgi:hypothetical protein
MAVLQTVYTDQVAPGYAGMVANAETSNRITRTNEDAASLPFGRAVFRGTGDHGCTATVGAGFLGISIAHETLGLLAGATADAFPQFASVPIMTLGVIWVNTSVAVAKGDQAYVTSAGLLTNVSTSNTILTGWFFDTTTAAAGLAKLAKR